MAQTATVATQRDMRLHGAILGLLHRLRDWVRIYVRNPEDEPSFPDFAIAWVTGVGNDGPQRLITDAIKMHPEMWVDALPAECCIVRRDVLNKLAGPEVADVLVSDGAAAVADQAARMRYEAEQRERENDHEDAETLVPMPQLRWHVRQVAMPITHHHHLAPEVIRVLQQAFRSKDGIKWIDVPEGVGDEHDDAN